MSRIVFWPYAHICLLTTQTSPAAEASTAAASAAVQLLVAHIGATEHANRDIIFIIITIINNMVVTVIITIIIVTLIIY